MRHQASSRAGSKQPNGAPIQIALIYELLDAHDDTSRLATGTDVLDHDWRAHLDYLRALQRKGREALAHLALEMNP